MFRRRSKYGNCKVKIDGHVFDSRKEAYQYLHLKERLQKGEISNLRLQVPYELIPAIYETETVHLKTKDKSISRCVQKAVHYVADFVYVDNATGKEIVQDANGFLTPEYVLKKKMMRAFRGISIIEI